MAGPDFQSECAKSQAKIVVPHAVPFPGQLAAATIFLLLQSVAASLRFRVVGNPDFSSLLEKQPVIFAVWHNRLALSLPIYKWLIQKAGSERKMAAMVSASKDGALLARVLEHFGVQPVRGSTSRRGPQALLELTTWAERGYDLAITPDGPRGPQYVVQDGVISLAQLTGRPIMPISYFINPKINLSSWDRFQIPIPFGKVEIVFGSPVYVPREISEKDREMCRKKLEETLRAMTRDD